MTDRTETVMLARILDALEADLVGTSERELADVLTELGLKPEMKGSAALLDVISQDPSVAMRVRAVSAFREMTIRASKKADRRINPPTRPLQPRK